MSSRRSTKPQRALKRKSYAELDLDDFDDDHRHHHPIKQQKSSTPPNSNTSTPYSFNTNNSTSATRRSQRNKKPTSSASPDNDKNTSESKPSHIISETSASNTKRTTRQYAEGDLSDRDDGVTRCACGLQPDDHDDIMIQCEDCAVWQHGVCMGIPDLTNCPEKYYCELCRPDMHPTNLGTAGSRYRPTTNCSTTTKVKRRNTFNSREAEQPSLPAEDIMKEYGIPKPIDSFSTNRSQTRTKFGNRKRSITKSVMDNVMAADSQVVEQMHVVELSSGRNSTNGSPMHEPSAGKAQLPKTDTATPLGRSGSSLSESPDSSRCEDEAKGMSENASLRTSSPKRRITRSTANQLENQKCDDLMDGMGNEKTGSEIISSFDVEEESQMANDNVGSKRRKTAHTCASSLENISSSVTDMTSINPNPNARITAKKSTVNITTATLTDSNTILVPATYITSTRRNGKQSAMARNNPAGLSGATPPLTVTTHPYYETLGDLVKVRAKVRQTHSRMSFTEMNKRAKLILDYITRVQIERAENLERQEKDDAREREREKRERRRRHSRAKTEYTATRILGMRGKREGKDLHVGTVEGDDLNTYKDEERDVDLNLNGMKIVAEGVTPTTGISILATNSNVPEKEFSQALDKSGVEQMESSRPNARKKQQKSEKPLDESLAMMDSLTRDIIKFQKRYPAKGRRGQLTSKT